MSQESSQLSNLTPRQLEALQSKLQARNESTPKDQIPRRTLEGPLPLTRAQRPYWFRAEIYESKTAQNLTLPFRIEGPLNPDHLEWGLERLVDRHAIFRTTFKNHEGVPCQEVHTDKSLTVDRVDLSDYPEDVREAQLRKTIEKMSNYPFDLGKDLMIQSAIVTLRPDSHALILVLHHLVFDFGSLKVLWSELSDLYETAAQAAQMGEEPAVSDELPIQYADYAVWENQQHEQGAFADQLEYWRDQMEGVPLRTPLPVDRLPEDDGEPALSETSSLTLPEELVQEVHAWCLSNNVTDATAMFAAYQVLLHRLTGEPSLVVAYPTTSRHRPTTRTLIGPFSNDLPQRGDIDADDTIKDVVAHVQDQILTSQENADISIQELLQALPGTRRRAADRVTSTSFNVMKRGFAARMLPGLDVEPIAFGKQARMPIEIQFVILERDECVDATITYDVEIFDEPTIQLWLQGYVQILEQVVSASDTLVGDVELPDALLSWSDTAPMDDYTAIVDGDNDVEYVEPTTQVEKMLAETWEDLLDLDRVGRMHDFFFAGGHSLTATVLTTRIREAFGVDVTLIDVFRRSRLDQMGEVIEEALIQNMNEADLAREMEDIQALDDKAVDEELSQGMGDGASS